MLIVPLQAVPSQTLNIVLANQACTIDVLLKSTGLFVDLSVNSALIIGGVVALNAVRIVRDSYLSFIGDLIFVDIQPDPVTGPADPLYTGLGSRWLLFYLDAGELSGDV